MPEATPLWPVPELQMGNQPIDGGHYLVEPKDLIELDASERALVQNFLRPYVGGKELLSGQFRNVLWLPEEERQSWARSRFISDRLQEVRVKRLSSKSAATRRLAETPSRWNHTLSTEQAYLAFPEVSSEARAFIPLAPLPAGTIPSNKLKVVAGVDLSFFSIYSSTMFNAWVRLVTGRLESRLSVSAAITYNPFPFPAAKYDSMRTSLADSGQKILAARTQTSASLADIYSNLEGYPDVLEAHIKNDALVDVAYGYQGLNDDASRFDFLYALYEARLAELSAAGDSRTS